MVQDAIERQFALDEEIDVLFISHYDRDHINGVHHLLKTRHVKQLVLPLVSRELLALDWNHGYIEEFTLQMGLNFQTFVERPEEVNMIRLNENFPETKVSFVREDEWGNDRREPLAQNEYNEEQVRNLRNFNNTNSNILSSGVFCLNDWLYIIYNRKCMTRDEWESFVKGIGLNSGATVADVLAAWKENKLKMKGALMKAKVVTEQTINSYSMTLLSVHSDNIFGCLYTGDYDANNNYDSLSSAYGVWLNNLELIQIPHHGSEYNFSKEFLNLPCWCCGVISVKAPTYPLRRGDVDPRPVINDIKMAGRCVRMTWQGDVDYCSFHYGCCACHRCHRCCVC